MHATPPQLDEEEHVDGPQEERLDGEEITGEHLVAVVLDEGTPRCARLTPLRRKWSLMSFEDAPDSGAPDGISLFDQLSVDSTVYPARIPVANCKGSS